MEMMTAEIESECWQFLSLPDQSRGEPGSEFPCPFLRLKCLNISFHLLQWVSACMHNVLTVLFHMELTSSNTSYRPLISWTACEGSEWRGISIKSPITAEFKKRRLLKTEQRKMARNCEMEFFHWQVLLLWNCTTNGGLTKESFLWYWCFFVRFAALCLLGEEMTYSRFTRHSVSRAPPGDHSDKHNT